ncbi:MAG: type IV pilus biogenesis protein PilM, partial [Pyrinomonadaceae bacterium]
MFKQAKKSLVGLDIGSSSVKAVELQKRGNSILLTNLGYETLQPDTIVDGQIMELNNVSNVIANIFTQHQIKTPRVAAGVSGHSVIVKNIVLPQMSEEELRESFSWHAEEHIPFDIADVNLDYQLTGSSSDKLQVLMAACKSDKIANVKQAIQLAGKQPVVIDVDTFALQNCYEVNYQPNAGE